MTDKQKVKQYMEEHGSITTAEAFTHLGCSRLSGRIYDLKADGVPIRKEMIPVKNRDGEKTYVAQYSIGKEAV